MRLFDIMILAVGILAAVSWTIVSSKDGFKVNNSTIVARSILVSSTIDGQIDNDPPEVGTQVSSKDLLVRVFDNRIDRSRLVEFESQIEYLNQEVENATAQNRDLMALLKDYEQRAKTYSVWMLQDVQLRNVESTKQLEVAKKQNQLKTGEVKRAAQLFSQKHTSGVNLTIAETEAEIARSQVDLTRAQLQRNRLLLQSLENDGVFFENGDTSYWAKMVDTLKVRYLDNRNKIATLNAQLIRARSQADVERARIGTSFAEEHNAPFDGMVNASFVTKGTRVVSGTSLMEVLDCANPIVIVPLPEHRLGEFSVGMKVSIYPIDSEQEIPGTIKYISSAPLIGHDKSLQIQQELTLRGVRAVVGFDDREMFGNSDKSCETAHKAVVVVHMDSVFDSLSDWLNTNMPMVAGYLSVFDQGTAEASEG